MSYRDDYYDYQNDNLISAVGCYCKINFVCSECKESYN